MASLPEPWNHWVGPRWAADLDAAGAAAVPADAMLRQPPTQAGLHHLPQGHPRALRNPDAVSCSDIWLLSELFLVGNIKKKYI